MMVRLHKENAYTVGVSIVLHFIMNCKYMIYSQVQRSLTGSYPSEKNASMSLIYAFINQ